MCLWLHGSDISESTVSTWLFVVSHMEKMTQPPGSSYIRIRHAPTPLSPYNEVTLCTFTSWSGCLLAIQVYWNVGFNQGKEILCPSWGCTSPCCCVVVEVVLEGAVKSFFVCWCVH